MSTKKPWQPTKDQQKVIDYLNLPEGLFTNLPDGTSDETRKTLMKWGLIQHLPGFGWCLNSLGRELVGVEGGQGGCVCNQPKSLRLLPTPRS